MSAPTGDPAIAAKTRPSPLPTHYVQHSAGLEHLLRAVETAPVFGFDTEFVGEHFYEPQLCLLQLSTAEGIWLVDPVPGLELGPLWELMTDPSREMVVLAAREEVRFCLRFARRAPERVLDLQVAAALTGLGYPLSHTNLVKRLMNVSLNHRETFTDWRKRPLTSGQLEYAADDVRFLLEMRDLLRAEAAALRPSFGPGRWNCVEAECRRMVERYVAGESEERWDRLPGAMSLHRRDQAVLRELWRWREGRAQSRNQPVRRVMRDEILVEIARRKPVDMGDLLALRGLDRAAATGMGPEILAAATAGMVLPESELPVSRKRRDPPQVPLLAQILSLACQQIAARHRVDPAMLATTADLQEVVRWRLAGASPDEPFVLTGWRGELLRQPLLEILEGRRHLRVSDPNSPAPLVFEDT